MGYNEGECVACYCKYASNNRVDDDEEDTQYEVCLTCISKFTRAGYMTSSILYTLKNSHWSGNSTCDLCDDTRIVTIDISLCDYHLTSELSEGEEEEDEEEEEELIFELGS